MRLHPKYGVNPTVAVCQFCQKETGEVVLLGAAFPRKADHKMVVNPWPCHNCLAEWKGLGAIAILCVKHNRSGEPIPTGKMIGVSADWVSRMIHPEELREQILEKRIAMMEEKEFDTLTEGVDL